MSVKIQINSLEALERLVGSEDTMEVEVRRAVIASFAKGFVKSVHNTDGMQAVAKKIVASLNQETVNQAQNILSEQGVSVKKKGWSGYTIDLGNMVETKIRNEVKSLIHDTILGAVSDIDVEGLVDEYVSVRVTREVNAQVRNFLKTSAGKMIQEAMKTE